MNVARAGRALGVPALLVGFTRPNRRRRGQLIADEGSARAGAERRRAAVHGRDPGARRPGHGHERARACHRSRGLGALRGGRRLATGRSRRARLQRKRSSRDAARRIRTPGGAGPPEAVVAIVDTSGAALGAALQSRPDLVCPNLAEAEGLLGGRADETVEAGDPTEVRLRAASAAAGARRHGAGAAVVTAEAGCGGGGRHGGHLAPGSCPRRSASRSAPGDALVGGLAAALERGAPLERGGERGPRDSGRERGDRLRRVSSARASSPTGGRRSAARTDRCRRCPRTRVQVCRFDSVVEVRR